MVENMFSLITIVFISFSLCSGSDYQVNINLEVGGVSQVTMAMRLRPRRALSVPGRGTTEVQGTRQ